MPASPFAAQLIASALRHQPTPQDCTVLVRSTLTTVKQCLMCGDVQGARVFLDEALAMLAREGE